MPPSLLAREISTDEIEAVLELDSSGFFSSKSLSYATRLSPVSFYRVVRQTI